VIFLQQLLPRPIAPVARCTLHATFPAVPGADELCLRVGGEGVGGAAAGRKRKGGAAMGGQPIGEEENEGGG
jgi:hypothetical protein